MRANRMSSSHVNKGGHTHRFCLSIGSTPRPNRAGALRTRHNERFAAFRDNGADMRAPNFNSASTDTEQASQRHRRGDRVRRPPNPPRRRDGQRRCQLKSLFLGSPSQRPTVEQGMTCAWRKCAIHAKGMAMNTIRIAIVGAICFALLAGRPRRLPNSNHRPH